MTASHIVLLPYNQRIIVRTYCLTCIDGSIIQGATPHTQNIDDKLPDTLPTETLHGLDEIPTHCSSAWIVD